MSPKNGTRWATLIVLEGELIESLAQDCGNGAVTFNKGLTVEYLRQGESGYYNVLLSGQITDAGSVYNFDRMIIFTAAVTQSGPIAIDPAA